MVCALNAGHIVAVQIANVSLRKEKLKKKKRKQKKKNNQAGVGDES